MKNKLLYIIAACALTAAFALGLTGVVALADKDAGEAVQGDRLVGMLVTTESLDLFDMEGYIKDHTAELFNGGMIEGDTSAYQGRLYATLVDETYTDEAAGETRTAKRYVFEGVEGIEYFYAEMDDEVGTYTAHFGNEAISDGSSSMNVTDEGTDFTLEGVIYVTAAAAGRTWFLNPVYQAADGSVYAINGSGTSSSGDIGEGATFWQTISAEYTVIQDGKTTTDSVTAKIGIILMYVPERLRIIQFNPDGAVLTLEEYAPGTLPETIRPEADAAYLVVETYKTAPDGKTTVSRTLYERGAEYIDAYGAREDGICVKQATALDWGK